MTLAERIEALEEELREGMPSAFHPSNDQVRMARLDRQLLKLVNLVRQGLRT